MRNGPLVKTRNGTRNGANKRTKKAKLDAASATIETWRVRRDETFVKKPKTCWQATATTKTMGRANCLSSHRYGQRCVSRKKQMQRQQEQQEEAQPHAEWVQQLARDSRQKARVERERATHSLTHLPLKVNFALANELLKL